MLTVPRRRSVMRGMGSAGAALCVAVAGFSCSGSGPRVFLGFGAEDRAAASSPTASSGQGESAPPATATAARSLEPPAPATTGTPPGAPPASAPAEAPAASPARAASPAPAGPGPAAPRPPDTPEAPPPEPVPAYWVLQAEWRSDHHDLLRKLQATAPHLLALDPVFVRVQTSLRELGKRLTSQERADLEGFLARYEELRREARSGGVRGIIHERAYRLGNDIRERFPRERS